MEAKGVSSGVTVVGSDAPTDYHITPRTDSSAPLPGSEAQVPGSSPAPATSQFTVEGTGLKKKRGRPRKYSGDGSVPVALSAKPISSAPPSGGVIDFSVEKRPKIKSAADKSQHQYQNQPQSQTQPKFESENSGEWVSCSAGANFTPHIITVNAGEDVTMKVISFSQQGPRAICILSANGVISSVTLRQPDSSGGTLTYEGRFELLSLSGAFVPSESGGIRNRSGGMSVSLSGPDGRVVGGSVAGLLVAATPVQIVVGSFLVGNKQEQKPTKQNSGFTISASPTSAVPFSSVGVQESYRGQGQGQHAAGTTYESFHGDGRNGSSDNNNESYQHHES